MPFPRRTDVARHLIPKSRSVSRVGPEAIPISEVAKTDLPLPGRDPSTVAAKGQSSCTSAFLTESATSKPPLTPDEFAFLRRAGNSESTRSE